MVAQRRDDLVVEQVYDEFVVFNHRMNTATALNTSASVIFELCDGAHSIEEMRAALLEAGLDVAGDDAVWLALDELADAGLIDLQTPKVAHLSRRELLTRYGVGAAALSALPVVESITAPLPSAAGSAGNQPPPPQSTTTTTTTVATPSPSTIAPTPSPSQVAPTPSPSTIAPTPSPSQVAPTPSPSTIAPTTPPS